MATVREKLQEELGALEARIPVIKAELASGEAHLEQEWETFKTWLTAKWHSVFGKPPTTPVA